MKKIIFLIFLIPVATAAFWVYQQRNYLSRETVIVEFDPGTSLRKISKILAEKKVISNARFFEYYARLYDKSKEIKAGEYEFKQGILLDETLKIMVEGRVILHPFTVPEGYNLRQIGELAEQKGIATPDQWIGLVTDKDYAGKLGLTADTLEGYLFPETYFLQKKTPPKELVERMVREFRKKITTDLMNKAQSLGFNLHQWVTLASVIEKETGASAERPLIASVFLNRLKINMPLQSDPTVIYGIPDFNGNLTKTDLEADGPYNTYTRQGLPPGPICSPGMNSLMAVLNPAPSDYLYFVAKGDGTHQFSKTLEEHNQAVQLYQIQQEQAPQSQGLQQFRSLPNKSLLQTHKNIVSRPRIV